MLLSILISLTSIATSWAQATQPCAQISASLAAQPPAATGAVDVNDAYECLTSVPVDTTGDLELLENIRVYLQWQSTVSYLKDPPSGYQQPATDLPAKLDNLTAALEQGTISDEYTFQIDLYHVLLSAYDGYVPGR